MATTTQPAVLTELFARAGASDEDRPAWLAERRGGLTATEVRDLVVKGPSFKRELLDSKSGRTPEMEDLSHVPVIGWGRGREAMIADAIRDRYSINNEHRVFRAADNPRKLASPDGIGVNFDEQLVVSEIKTAGMDISVGSPKFAEKGYMFQMQWVMRVTGARRCLYAWEYRLDGETTQFEAGQLHFEWVEYDEEIVALLERIADDFLAELDAYVTNDGPEIDEQLDTMAVNYLRFLEEEKTATTAKKAEWEAMLERLEGCDALSVESPLARVTYSPGEESVVEEFDVEAAKVADPDLFARVQALSKEWNEHQAKFKKSKTVPARPNLRVTPVKPKAVKE